MSDKKGISPWLLVVVLGVVAILFSVFAIQQEYDLDEAHATIAELRKQLSEAEQKALVAEARAAENALEAMRQKKLADEALLQMQEDHKKQKGSK